MNIGQIDPESEKFLNDYKKFGYSTKTQMANDAFKAFRLLKAKEAREAWRKAAFEQVAELAPDIAFDDGEDFVQGR